MADQNGGHIRAVINPPVFYASAVLILLFVLFAAVFTDAAGNLFTTIHAWITHSAGWFYILAVAFFVVFVAVLALTDLGRIRLGPDHSEPDYGYGTWFAMLFAAGMGIGLMFFGVAEPIMHYTAPPTGDAQTVEAAREAMRITFFHWGIHAWAIYAVVALSLAYFAFRHGLPLTMRSALYPLIGERIHGPIGHAVDTFAVLGTVFGLATSLGLGAMQVNSGLAYLFDLPNGVFVQVVLIIIITAVATTSVVLGLDRGIRRLSELNMILAVALMVFVLAAGPTVYLLQTLVQNTGTYLSGLFHMTFNLYARQEPTGWIGGWTLFYWGWWIAWSPFVGMFIARISRGRTIREFVWGVLMVPVGFTFMWMTFFGDTAIHMVMVQGFTQLSDAVALDPSVALFQFLEHLPLSMVTSVLATVLVIVFFVTSSDSATFVVDMLTAGGQETSPVWQRVFWAAVEGVVAVVLLLAGGLSALQTATIASALPFLVVMLLMCWGLVSALSLEAVKRTSLREARLTPHDPRVARHWRQRLRGMIHQPTETEVRRFLREVVRPALTAVAEELSGQQLRARVAEGEDGRIWMEVAHGEEIDFFYCVRPRAYAPPSFVMRDMRRRPDEPRYFRAEVHLREGGQDYDVMGWSQEEVIGDLLDQYERHMHFLNAVR